MILEQVVILVFFKKKKERKKLYKFQEYQRFEKKAVKNLEITMEEYLPD